jgi:hypothetical protein
MPHEPRSISFLERDGRVKHYSIAAHDRRARPALAGALRAVAAEPIGDSYGFTIAHDTADAALGIAYWWANDNEIHSRYFIAPHDDPGALEPVDGDTGMACVWELEVIDFERRAWLEYVLKNGDTDAYLHAVMEDVEL